ncbi:hypothetical protein QJQ45_003308 [Haematococcus lacustris]|nr:hypothetical protein QJQ45_003308 [Haematococcus lacustris]
MTRGLKGAVFGPITGNGGTFKITTCFPGAADWDSALAFYQEATAPAMYPCNGVATPLGSSADDDPTCPYSTKLSVTEATLTNGLNYFVVVEGMKWVSRQHYGRERGAAVLLGAGCFSQGGWKVGAVQDGLRKVVEQTSRPSTFDMHDRLVIMDEFRTSRVSSSVHAPKPSELHLPRDRPRPADWEPPAGQVIQRLVRPT